MRLRESRIACGWAGLRQLHRARETALGIGAEAFGGWAEGVLTTEELLAARPVETRIFGRSEPEAAACRAARRWSWCHAAVRGGRRHDRTVNVRSAFLAPATQTSRQARKQRSGARRRSAPIGRVWLSRSQERDEESPGPEARPKLSVGAAGSAWRTISEREAGAVPPTPPSTPTAKEDDVRQFRALGQRDAEDHAVHERDDRPPISTKIADDDRFQPQRLVLAAEPENSADEISATMPKTPTVSDQSSTSCQTPPKV